MGLYFLLFFFQAAFFRFCFCIYPAKQSADDQRRDRIACSAYEPLQEHFVSRLCVNHDIQHRSNQRPAENMANHNRNDKTHDIFIPEQAIPETNFFRRDAADHAKHT